MPKQATKKKKSALLRWEYVVPVGKDFNNPREDPGVRRVAVVGGWLYQVQRALHFDPKEEYEEPAIWWHPPVFVPMNFR